MADIFVSYARSDKARVEPLVAALEAQGWSVWWDPAITPGQEFDSQISAALDAAKAVIVVWTPQSVDSRWVRGEAREAADRGVLVPVRFEAARLPIDARAMHTTDLDDWNGDVNAQAFRDLCRAVTALAERGQSQLRAGSPAAAPAPKPAKAAPPAGFWKRFSPVQMAITAAVLALLVGGGFFLFLRAPSKALHPIPLPASGATTNAPSAEGGVTLAVLPFVNMSDDKQQEYFSDGLSEEMMNQLAQIKGLRVTGRTSSFAFKGKNEDLRVIGETLGVANLLEGSVRKSGTRLRITAQLINAADGTHLWSQTYDKELTDVFAIQEEIAMAVTDALSITLGVGDMARLSGGTKNVEAYDLYLKGQAALNNVGGAEGARQALQFFHQAVAADPSFVAGWYGVGSASFALSVWAPEQTEAVRAEVVDAAKHLGALSLNKAQTLGLQEAQAYYVDHDLPAAGRAFDQLLAIDPAATQGPLAGDETTRGQYLAAFGRIGEAIEHLKAGTLADPLSLGSSMILQWLLDMAGRHGEAEAEYQRTKDLPGAARGQARFERMARLWAQGANPALAKAELAWLVVPSGALMPVYKDLLRVYDDKAASQELLKRAFDDPFYQDGTRLPILAVLAAHYGDTDLALAALRRGLVDKKGPGIFNLWKPEFAEARKDPRFKAIVRDLGLVTYWRESGHWGDFCHPLGTDDFECK